MRTVFRIVTVRCLIGMPVKRSQVTIQCIEAIARKHTALLMKNMMGTPRRDGLRLAYYFSVTGLQ